MKTIVNGIFAFLVLACSYSCKKNHEPDGLQPDDPSLEKNIPENTVAKDFVSSAVYDLFISGHTIDSTGGEWGYWKNSDWNTLVDARDVSGIFADDNHIYVSGTKIKTINGIGGYKAAYWVDGNVILPQTSSNSFSEATSIGSYNGKVYTCGYETDQTTRIAKGIIWENETPLYTFPGIYLYDLRIINGDLVVAGAGADPIGKFYNYIYKNGTLLFKSPTFSDLPVTEFDAYGGDWVIAGLGEDYYINGMRQNLISKDYGWVSAINITPAKKILLAGRVAAYDRNNPPSFITMYPGLWRDGRFDRLESRYPGELKDVKSIDDMEYVAGNIYSIGTANPFQKGSQATVWVNNDRYQLHGLYKWNYISKMFIKRK